MTHLKENFLKYHYFKGYFLTYFLLSFPAKNHQNYTQDYSCVSGPTKWSFLFWNLAYLCLEPRLCCVPKGRDASHNSKWFSYITPGHQVYDSTLTLHFLEWTSDMFSFYMWIELDSLIPGSQPSLALPWGFQAHASHPANCCAAETQIL